MLIDNGALVMEKDNGGTPGYNNDTAVPPRQDPKKKINTELFNWVQLGIINTPFSLNMIIQYNSRSKFIRTCVTFDLLFTFMDYGDVFFQILFSNN